MEGGAGEESPAPKGGLGSSHGGLNILTAGKGLFMANSQIAKCLANAAIWQFGCARITGPSGVSIMTK